MTIIINIYSVCQLIVQKEVIKDVDNSIICAWSSYICGPNTLKNLLGYNSLWGSESKAVLIMRTVYIRVSIKKIISKPI